MTKKKETKKEEKVEVKVVKKDDRKARWDALVSRYKVASPIKYAIKNDKGVFKRIPATFK